MRTHHVTHLLTRYVHGQLRPAQQARVVNHICTCAACRAALVREERIASDLAREMPTFGQPSAAQLAGVWAGVWQDLHPPRGPRVSLTWLPGLSVMLALAMVLMVALPLLAQSGIRAEAAPLQPRPADLASPTPDATETGEALRAGGFASPQATVALAVMSGVGGVGATPAPVPAVTVSPVTR